MSETDKIQDRIDEYINGIMSAEDRGIFEEELCRNAELRHEVEVQLSIADAVQSVHIKRLLQKVETEIHVSTKRKAFSARAWIWASAAAVTLLLFFGYSWKQTWRLKLVGAECYATLTEPLSRGGTAIDSLMVSWYSYISAGNYFAAQEALDSARIMIYAGLDKAVHDEETEYEHQILKAKLYDVDWYEAVLLMQKGECRRTKVAIVAIAATDSPYADKSIEILNTMFHIKF